MTERISNALEVAAGPRTEEAVHPLQSYLEELHTRHAGCHAGEVATHIAQLAEADPAWFAIAMATTDGRVYTVGDFERPFAIRSIAKPFVYALALQDNGHDGLLEKLAATPSGDAPTSNSLHQQLGQPFNPMTNAGAIACTGLVRSDADATRIDRIVELLSRCAGRQLSVDEEMVASERESGSVNFTVDYMLRSTGIAGSPLEPVLDCFSQQSSVLVTCRDLAIMAATLANEGICPTTGERAIDAAAVSHLLGVMATCGLYDYAGEWICRVGMPSKSATSGGILGVLPGNVGIAIFSPPLDSRGNSVRGIRVFHDLSEDFDLRLFQATRSGKSVIRRRYDGAAVCSKRVRRIIESQALVEHGHRIVVYELQGELTLFSVEKVIRDILALPDYVSWLIFDFQRMFSADWPALDLWLSFWEHVRERFREVIVTGLDADAGLAPYFASALARRPDALLLMMEETDAGLELCEDHLLHMLGLVASADAAVHLENFDLCNGLDAASIGILRSVLRSRDFQPGDAIVQAGDPADSLFFLASGQCSVTIDLAGGTTKRLGTCTPGMLFGEMAILERRPRSAAVRADTFVQCFELTMADFQRLTDTHPDLKVKLLENFARSLSMRLRRLTDEVRTLSE